jgi:hypothetical protein
MAFIQVVGMFDDPADLERAKVALMDAGVATEGTMRVEPEHLVAELHPLPPPPKGVLDRLKLLLNPGRDKEAEAYAEGARRGSVLLVVTVPEEQAETVRRIMQQHHAVDLWRRVKQWEEFGWTGYDPDAPPFVRVEPAPPEEQFCITEEDEAAARQRGDGPPTEEFTVRLLDGATGREIGRITETELAVLQDALEDEGPGDDDYWINADTIDMLACRPGATPHLITLLRRAVGDNPDGIDIAFQRGGQPVRSLRGSRATRPVGDQ